MSFDTESKRAGFTVADVAADAQHVGRVARSLGRGLQDISHVFLTPELRDTRGVEHTDDRATERAPLQPGAKVGTVLLRRCGPPSREQLAATLKEFAGALGDQVRAIDGNIACSPYGEIDLVALDGNRLALIDVDPVGGDALVLRGMSHFEWVVRNLATVQRMYRGVPIDFSAAPRLFLVAPEFSAFARSAARQITRPDIQCFRYHAVNAYGAIGILFEAVGGAQD